MHTGFIASGTTHAALCLMCILIEGRVLGNACEMRDGSIYLELGGTALSVLSLSLTQITNRYTRFIMPGPCLCGDPYCGSCGDPSALVFEGFYESLFSKIEEGGFSHEDDLYETLEERIETLNPTAEELPVIASLAGGAIISFKTVMNIHASCIFNYMFAVIQVGLAAYREHAGPLEEVLIRVADEQHEAMQHGQETIEVCTRKLRPIRRGFCTGCDCGLGPDQTDKTK